MDIFIHFFLVCRYEFYPHPLSATHGPVSALNSPTTQHNGNIETLYSDIFETPTDSQEKVEKIIVRDNASEC